MRSKSAASSKSSLLVLAIILVAACSSEIKTTSSENEPQGGSTEEAEEQQPKAELEPVINALSALAARPGEVVEVSGQNLIDGMEVTVNGILAELTVTSAIQASFVMPDRAGIGLVDVAVMIGDRTVKTLSLISDGAGDGVPFAMFSPDQVCQGLKFRNASGAIQQGSKVCTQPSACTADGSGACVVDGTTFKAANVTNLAGTDIRSGITIAGISGTLDPDALMPDAHDVRQGTEFGSSSTGSMRPMMACKNGRGISGLGGSRSTPYDGTLTQASIGGSVAISSGSTTVTGTGTNFNLHVGVGDSITVAGETRRIVTHVNQTLVTVDTAFTQTLTGQNFSITPSPNADLTIDDNQAHGIAVAAPPGVVSTTSGSTTLRGSGTSFTTDISKGDFVTVNGEQRIVVAIADDEELTVGSSFGNTNASSSYSLINYYAPSGNCNAVDSFKDVTNSGVGMTPDSSKRASWKRIFQDDLTGTYFTNVLSTIGSWTVATDACAALNGGTGGSGWRLPTQKELQQLYINGLGRMGTSSQSAFGATTAFFWSSSLIAYDPTFAWDVYLAVGQAYPSNRATAMHSFFCVR